MAKLRRTTWKTQIAILKTLSRETRQKVLWHELRAPTDSNGSDSSAWTYRKWVQEGI